MQKSKLQSSNKKSDEHKFDNVKFHVIELVFVMVAVSRFNWNLQDAQYRYKSKFSP